MPAHKINGAISKMTAAEIVYHRADSSKVNMGLTSWKQAPQGKILKTDVSVAKNDLQQKEISELNRLVELYLNFAELQAERQIPMKMTDWAKRLDAFLQLNEYELLKDLGKISHALAKTTAEKEFRQFRVLQDKNFESDFDKSMKTISQKADSFQDKNQKKKS